MSILSLTIVNYSDTEHTTTPIHDITGSFNGALHANLIYKAYDLRVS